MHIEWLRDENAAPASAIDPPGTYGGADRAGHVFVWSSDHLNVLANGDTVLSLPDPFDHTMWPEPRGTQFAIRTPTGIEVYAIDGKRRWALALPQVEGVVWLDDDTVAIVGAGSLARVSAASGKLIDVRCGWAFQLSDTPLPASNVADTLCTRS